MRELYKVEMIDLDRCADNLAEAFRGDPLLLHLINEESYDQKKVRELFYVSLKYVMENGYLYGTSSDLEGVVAILLPKKTYIPTLDFLRNGGLSLIKKVDFGVIPRLLKYENYAKKLHDRAISEDHYYIFTLGVDSSVRRRGYAKKLLTPFLTRAKREGRSIYLETHKEVNVDIYKRFGFRLVETGQVPKSQLKHYTMLFD